MRYIENVGAYFTVQSWLRNDMKMKEQSISLDLIEDNKCYKINKRIPNKYQYTYKELCLKYKTKAEE